MRFLEIIPIFLHVYVVVGALTLLHFGDILDVFAALTKFFAFGQEVRQGLWVKYVSQNRYLH